VAQPVSFSSVPAAATRGKCVAAGSVPEGKPTQIAKAPKKKRRSKGTGFVPYNDDKSAQAATSKPARTPSRPATMPAETGPSGGAPAAEPAPMSSAGDDAADEVAEMEAPASAPADDFGRNASEKRKDRRAERKAKRDRKKSERQAPALTAVDADAAGEADVAMSPPPEIVETIEPQWPPEGQGWGEATYLSNDDTMSMSSPQRVRYAIDKGLPLPLEHIRKHELLNAASFDVAPVERGHDFSIEAEIAPSNREDGLYTLALAVNGRPVGRDGRRNAVITLVVDRSGSMREEGRMDYLKRGLLRMVRELKRGDIVNLVTFDHRVCTVLENFVVGRDDSATLSKAVMGIKPSGSTNLHAGLTQGYRLADASYQPKYSNRVIIITDALANRGITDPKTLSMVTDFYDARRIRLSGVGVGRTFDDRLLDTLTEKGRGAYVFLGSQAQVEQVFGDGFTSLVETTANDVHYRLHLPVTMRMQRFYGEEASTHKADVQAVHFFADTSQLLMADVEAWQGQIRPQDGVMLEVEYQHPESGETLTEQYAFTVAQMSERDTNVRKGEVLMHFAENLEDMVRRFGGSKVAPPFSGSQVRDPAPVRTCQHTQRELAQLSRGLRDREVQDVQRLWSQFCARYGAPTDDRPPRKQ
jgi:Ca-activated chloride channel family protein